MKSRLSFLFILPISMIAIFSISACNAIEKIPVSVSDGLTLPELLSSNVELNNVDELSKLIKEPWYSEIVVKDSNGKTLILSSCEDYFVKSSPETKLTKQYEMNAYIELKVMCEASKLMLSAKPSMLSYLHFPILDENSPNYLPKQLSLITSSEELKRNNRNQALKYWSDVTPITGFQKNSESSFTYYHNGGYQEVDIIGRGDVNSDGIEDLIVVVRDYVSNGSYFNMRLLVLTIDDQKNWSLISEY
ncbi:hypothetical protein EXA16_17365 [Vibrio cincinnatiensis]|uniref:hypothetical protein n=1 Tax=Vibrio TaxID=662 RepID=UPI001C301029|nr:MULTISPECIES: hypothetical protein [Vibrio]MCG3738066.1 hypothetical protein [Vibrio cincinnatiensis]